MRNTNILFQELDAPRLEHVALIATAFYRGLFFGPCQRSIVSNQCSVKGGCSPDVALDECNGTRRPVP